MSNIIEYGIVEGKKSKDPCVQSEPINIDPNIQDRTLSILVYLPLLELEAELPVIEER